MSDRTLQMGGAEHQMRDDFWVDLSWSYLAGEQVLRAPARLAYRPEGSIGLARIIIVTRYVAASLEMCQRSRTP